MATRQPKASTLWPARQGACPWSMQFPTDSVSEASTRVSFFDVGNEWFARPATRPRRRSLFRIVEDRSLAYTVVQMAEGEGLGSNLLRICGSESGCRTPIARLIFRHPRS